jgi:hypothetical protein
MEEDTGRPRRRRRLIPVLVVAAALAAVPVGVALANGSGTSRDGRNGDCPKHHQDREGQTQPQAPGDGQSSTEL